jgi:hypothetical protein
MTRLHPRYVESLTPAVAAAIGIGIGLIASGSRRARWLAVPLTALLVLPLLASIEAVQANATDAGNVGGLAPAEQRALSAYLLPRQGSARFQLAAGSATAVASLIAADGRPVLMLTTYNGRPLTSVGALRRAIARGEVRYAFINSRCGRHSPKTTSGCAPAARWVRAHATDVSRAAGLASGLLWRLP